MDHSRQFRAVPKKSSSSPITDMCQQRLKHWRHRDPNTLSGTTTESWHTVRGIVPRARRGLAGEFAMPASIIWPVAASHRHLFRVHGLRALRLSQPLCCCFALSAWPLRRRQANCPWKRTAFICRLPVFVFRLPTIRLGKKRYARCRRTTSWKRGRRSVALFYAEPQHCVCIFIGTQQAYNKYLKLLSQPLKPTDNVAPDYKTQAGVLLSGQPLRQSTRGDPTTLSDLSEHPLPSLLRDRRGSRMAHAVK